MKRKAYPELADDSSLRADGNHIRQAAQKLVDAINSMLWAMQNISGSEDLRNDLVGCSHSLKKAIEPHGFTLAVKPGFQTAVVRKDDGRRRPNETEMEPDQLGLAASKIASQILSDL